MKNKLEEAVNSTWAYTKNIFWGEVFGLGTYALTHISPSELSFLGAMPFAAAGLLFGIARGYDLNRRRKMRDRQ